MAPKPRFVKAAETAKKPRTSSENPQEKKAAKVDEQEVKQNLPNQPQQQQQQQRKIAKTVVARRVRPFYHVQQFLQFSQRPTINKIPTSKCQTLLYQSAMQHLWGTEHFASFVLISETLRNSSFGANLIMNFDVNGENIALFNNIITPQKCMSLQFIHSLKIDARECRDDVYDFISQLVNTKYFHLQLQTLTMPCSRVSHVLSFFGHSSKAETWPQLRTLSLAHAPMSDTDVKHVTSKLPSLLSLNLDDCNVNDVGLQLIGKNLTSLTHLRVTNCFSVSDAGLLSIAANLKALKSLELQQCSGIGDQSLRYIVEFLPSLTRLVLGSCHSITDAGLESLTALKKLTSLHIYGTKIAHDTKNKIRAAFPNCRFGY